jgi:hypothetical protein
MVMDERKKYKESEMFRVPDNYFEELTEKVTEMAVTEIRKPEPGFFTLARPHLMLAASMILFVIISYATLKFLLPDILSDKPVLDSISITEYLTEELEEADLLEDADLADMNSSGSVLRNKDLNEDEIIDYLIKESISYEDILENL